jgi:hypothetical protein
LNVKCDRKKKAENVVATSIGNAFYETAEDNEENIVYKFNPSDAGLQFIEKLNPPANATEETLQEFVYNKIYLVNSLDIVVANGGESSEAAMSRHATPENATQREFHQNFSTFTRK